MRISGFFLFCFSSSVSFLFIPHVAASFLAAFRYLPVTAGCCSHNHGEIGTHLYPAPFSLDDFLRCIGRFLAARWRSPAFFKRMFC